MASGLFVCVCVCMYYVRVLAGAVVVQGQESRAGRLNSINRVRGCVCRLGVSGRQAGRQAGRQTSS